ncbi:TfoX/Sxy family protein [Chloroflexota bacterium]
MVWKKADPELINLLEDALKGTACERRHMFGSPTFFINNNMFAGVHQNTVILRLSEADRAALFADYDEAGPFTPMPGRPMREYAALPEPLAARPDVLNKWLEGSYRYASSLPPKPPGKKKKARRE